ncbi:MAG TPA: hypothetical protein VFH42_08660, partial [Sporolactobacillaceae bacterium]|nr:hypothetical protein [Sporolactobacillaceae bacterium]
GYNPSFGARPLRRVIEEHSEDAIADLLLEKDHVASIKVDVNEDKLVLI